LESQSSLFIGWHVGVSGRGAHVVDKREVLRDVLGLPAGEEGVQEALIKMKRKKKLVDFKCSFNSFTRAKDSSLIRRNLWDYDSDLIAAVEGSLLFGMIHQSLKYDLIKARGCKSIASVST
jgi:hypothetical protein